MPPGKKRRKRSLRNVTTTCEAESRSIPGSDMLSDASLISVKLIQVRMLKKKKLTECEYKFNVYKILFH